MKRDKQEALRKENEDEDTGVPEYDYEMETLLDEASTGSLRPAGLYIYDLTKMLSIGEVETYEVAEAVVGHNSHIDYS
jgi:hypothetical protein